MSGGKRLKCKFFTTPNWFQVVLMNENLQGDGELILTIALFKVAFQIQYWYSFDENKHKSFDYRLFKKWHISRNGFTELWTTKNGKWVLKSKTKNKN